MARVDPGRYLRQKGRSPSGGKGSGYSMTFSGGPELKKALEELALIGSTATAKNAFKRGMIRAATPMVALAKSLAPKDDHDLEQSIEASTRLSRRQKKMAGRVDKWTSQVFVGPDYRRGAHGVIQEFGTDNRETEGIMGVGQRSTGRIMPHPFMRPAFDSTVEMVFKAFAPEVWAELAKATKRIERKNARKAKRP
jgi:HK97 gp10 family phage protein